MSRHRGYCWLMLVVFTASTVGQETKKEADPKKEPPKVSTAEEAQKKAEQIIQNAQQAGKRLGDKDPGTETRDLQKENVRLIDELIQQAQNPPPNDNQPPPPKNGMSGGMGGGMGGGMSETKTGRQERRERREKADASRMPGNGGTDQQPHANRPEPKNNNSGAMSGQPNPLDRRPNPNRPTDPYKDVWGHLPEKMRQEMDLYYREQFIPRYAELLRQYYSSIAEKDRPGK